jgi:hypothetical protein
MYVGGSDGIVYVTIDGTYYREFWDIGDGPISSLEFYGGAMFAGTSPNGGIYMHNFNTGNRFHYVVSGDDEVSSMIVHNDILYAGTSRSGIILSYDGDRWRKEHESMRSVSSMVSFSDSLYVFFHDANTVLVNDGSKWFFMNDGDSVFSIGGSPVVSTSIDELSSYDFNESGIGGACVSSGKIYFYGLSTPTVYSYDGSSVNMEFQFGEGVISSIESSSKQVFVAIGDSLYANIYGGEDGAESSQGSNSLDGGDSS